MGLEVCENPELSGREEAWAGFQAPRFWSSMFQ